MRHFLINIQKIDIRLQDLSYEYTIDKNGVVIVDKPVVDKPADNSVDNQVDGVSVKSSWIEHVVNER